MRRNLSLIGGALVAASLLVLTSGPPAAAARTVSPERWARTVCSAWIRYTDDVERASFEFDEISTSVDDGALGPKKARREVIETQTDLVAAGSAVVRTVARSAAPDIEDGAAVRRDYLATVKDYRQTDVDVLGALQRLPVGSAARFVDGLYGALGDGFDAWGVIGYNPLVELKEISTLTAAIDGASECQSVDGWFDLGYLSDYEIGECFDADWETVDCSAEHQSELYLQIEYPAGRGEPFPGQKVVDQYAREQCMAAFAGYVGRAYDSSPLDFVYYTPDAQAWNANDREILCTIENADESPLTGPVHGTWI